MIKAITAEYFEKCKGIAFSLVPFHWIWPRIDRCILDTTVFCGPIRVYWINN